MDFLPGQLVFTRIGGNVYDGRGRPLGFVPAETPVQIAGAKKSIVTESAWFWAYPVAMPSGGRGFAWIPEGDLAAERGSGTFTGAMSDVTLPGYFFPPLGIYQALSGGSGQGAAPSSHAPTPPPESGLRVPWSAIASFAVVAGGALAVYFIYMASQKAIPIQRRAGQAAGKLLQARYGQMVPERRSYAREPVAELLPKTLPRRPALSMSAADQHPLLGAYDAYAPE